MNISVPPAMEQCRICDSQSPFLGRARILNKYEVSYYQCSKCGFVQTENPFWLTEAYSNAITSSDLGYIWRNQAVHIATRALISMFFNADGRFLDYGGGYGMMVRMMRDAGFDFYRSDLYCQNLFASGFDAPLNGERYELLTAFEVFEHLASPRDELATMLGFSSSVFFSTHLLPTPTPPLEQWWYYGLEHGQHVAFFTRRSLEILGSLHGLRLVSNNYNSHLFTPKAVSERVYRLVVHRGARLLNFIKRRPSLLPGDFLARTGKAAS